MDTAAGRDSVLEKWAIQLRKGSLDLAVLASLRDGPMYGLEILRRLAETAGLVVPEGTVYPLLSRLKSEGWVESSWLETGTGPARKYYRLTPAGRRHVAGMTQAWGEFAAGMERLLAPIGTSDR